MTITYHKDVIQGDDAWHAMRCGLPTSSEMSLLITPTFKVADNDKTRQHLFELLAQRITGYVEPRYVSDDMLRGQADEIEALSLYEQNYSPIQKVGFITNDELGFTIGYSPDALVGDDGLVEVKSRRAKYQVQTIVEGVVPLEYMIQVQTGFLVSKRKWLDFVSYSGGLPMFVLRSYPMPIVQEAIVNAVTKFEERLALHLAAYTKASATLIPTERKIEQEMF